MNHCLFVLNTQIIEINKRYWYTQYGQKIKLCNQINFISQKNI
jgi:hypothetical protein